MTGPAGAPRAGHALARRVPRGGWAGAAALVGVAGLVAWAVQAGSGGAARPTPGRRSGPATVEIAPRVTVAGDRLPGLVAQGADPALGRPAPTLVGVSFTGTPVTVTNTGRPHLVVFVAHWCPHCQAEVPRIVDLARRRQLAVPVTGVITGTDPAAPNYPPSSWLARQGWPYPVLVDTRAGTAAHAYGLPGYPFVVFVDALGRVAGRVSGELTEADLARLAFDLAAARPADLGPVDP